VIAKRWSTPGILNLLSWMLPPRELFIIPSKKSRHERRKMPAKMVSLLSLRRREDLREIGMQTPMIHMNLKIENVSLE
jgi:hypothetical protein